MDGVVAYFALDVARALLQWARGTRAPDAYYALATHVPYALAEELAANDDLYTPVLRTLFAGYSWDEGDNGVTVDEDGRYFFLAPAARVAGWVPAAERLLAAGAFALRLNGAVLDASGARFTLHVEHPPVAPPPTAAAGTTPPSPAVLDALQARHRPPARGVGPALVLRATYAALCGVRYPRMAHTDPRATDCAVPLAPPDADATWLSADQHLLEAQLALALEARVLVLVPPD